MSGLLYRLKPLVKRSIHVAALVARPMTLGVRALVVDERERVLLVRHTYVPGWYLPGGGVDPGEAMPAAVARELAEEAAIVVEGVPRLFSIYHNARASRRDHVGLYICETWSQPTPPAVPNREIAELGFFALGDLPEETTAATHRRLAEVFDGAVPDSVW
ncbi:MAG: DNA mismatch repair protein MutT [Hyphomicrobiales bacterium]|nr:MAG: DNA mismatch repair protein MutT [Hyphomicrobiales bacterium]